MITLVSMGLALGFVVVTPASAAQVPHFETTRAVAPSLSVSLELTVDDVPQAQQAQFVALTQTQLESLAAQQGLALAGSGPADLVMRVAISQPQGQTAVYLITSSVELDGATIGSHVEDVCLRCTAEEVAVESLSILPAAVEHARDARARAAAPAHEPHVASSADEQDQADLAGRVTPLSPVGYGGIASCALGLGAVIGGAVLQHRGQVVTSEPSASFVDTVDFRAPGVALIGAGLGAMVIGNVLIAVDLAVLRERRTSRHARLTGLGFTAHAGAVLSLHGQF